MSRKQKKMNATEEAGSTKYTPMRPEVGEPRDEEPVNGTGMELRGRGGQHPH